MEEPPRPIGGREWTAHRSNANRSCAFRLVIQNVGANFHAVVS